MTGRLGSATSLQMNPSTFQQYAAIRESSKLHIKGHAYIWHNCGYIMDMIET
jgi:hypothetical protein